MENRQQRIEQLEVEKDLAFRNLFWIVINSDNYQQQEQARKRYENAVDELYSHVFARR